MTIPFTPFEEDDEPSSGSGSGQPSSPPATAPPATQPASAAGATSGRPADEEDDEPRLGTAATISKAEASGRSGGGDGSGGRRSTRPKRRGRPAVSLGAVVLLAVLMAGLPLLKGAFGRVPKDRIGITYGGGPIEGVHFQRILDPGHGLFFNGFFDSLYLYPSDQLNYILADTPGKDGKDGTTDSVVAPTSDRVSVSFQVAVYYRLNTDLLRPFHEQLGLRYQAYTTSGWNRLIADTLRQQIEAALQEQTRRYEVADLYGDAELLVKIQNEVQSTITARLEAALGRRFFCGPTFERGGECGDPTFVIKRIDIPKAVADAFESNRTSEVLIATRENEVRQREAEARAIAVINEALAANSQAYVLLKAIESGKINFWVIPEGGDIDLTAPAATPPAGDGG